MKIAVLSDIHGNIAALDAVLAHAANMAVDGIVNLGDICSGGLWPVETADRLMALSLPTVRGNHERQVLDGCIDRMGPSDRHATMTLRDDQMAWLASLPATHRLSPDILMVHGTPDSDLVYFLETVTETGVRPATIDEVAERAGNCDVPVILCGHTHIPRAVRLDDGQLIVNPGSVGLQAYDDDRPYPHIMENGSPHARYAIVSNESGRWEADFHRVDYDWQQAAIDAEANNREDWARALRTGRV
jgi:putative phosphoesterase